MAPVPAVAHPTRAGCVAAGSPRAVAPPARSVARPLVVAAAARSCGTEPPATEAPAVGRRAALAAALCAVLASASPARAEEAAPAAGGAAAAVTPVYFGNGCFWGRQHDWVDLEKQLGRSPQELSAVVGYAGGKSAGPDGRVCYYYGPRNTVYEELGHAEVTQLSLRGPAASDAARREFRAAAEVYFRQFRKVPGVGFIRQDPQDAGPGYRNVVGIPGGADSPLFAELQAANTGGMRLLRGEGNARGVGPEGDLPNTVWVVDSAALPFHRAEEYHQFHNGLGKAFGRRYTRDLKAEVRAAGTIGPTGCPEWQGALM